MIKTMTKEEYASYRHSVYEKYAEPRKFSGGVFAQNVSGRSSGVFLFSSVYQG